jgi:hypothetical protein
MVKAKLKGERQIVPIALLHPNPWNPNVQSDFMFERERASIRRFGFIDPVTVRAVGKGRNAFLQIIDGEHRWRAAEMEGLEEITVENLGKMPDADAKALTEILNQLHGEPDKGKQAELIASILDEDGNLRSVLPYTEVQFEQFDAIVNFDWEGIGEGGNQGTDGDGVSVFTVRLTKDAHADLKKALEMVKNRSDIDGDADAVVAMARAYVNASPKKRGRRRLIRN